MTCESIVSSSSKSLFAFRVLAVLAFIPAAIECAQPAKIAAVGTSAPSTIGDWVMDQNGDYAWNGPATDGLYSWTTGQAGEIPVVGDWNGDGRTKMGVYVNGTWLLDYNGDGVWNDGVDKSLFLGGPGYVPVVGDWDGSGNTKIGAYNSSTGIFLIDYNGNFTWEGSPVDKVAYLTTDPLGNTHQTPVIGDWNGDGRSKIGVFAGGTWLLDYDGDYVWNPTFDKVVSWTLNPSSEVPMVGDWDGSHKTKIAVYYNGSWVVDYDGDFSWVPAMDQLAYFGGPGFVPVVGDWGGNGKTKIAAFSDGAWVIDVNGNFVWDLPADVLTIFVGAGQTPVVMYGVSISVSPQSIQLAGGAQRQFIATVTGAMNQSVIWSISPAGAGSITQAGLYTAPTNITNGQTITVIATSVADNTRSGAAAVTIPIDFAITLPANGQVVAGGAVYAPALTIIPINGFSAPVSFNWTNQAVWPPGLTASFINNGTSISVTAAPGTPGGNYTLSFTASGGGVTRTAKLGVTVIAKLYVWITADPNPVISGNSVTLTAHTQGGLPSFVYDWFDSTGIGGSTTSFPVVGSGFVSKNIHVSDAKGQSAYFQIIVKLSTTPEYSLNNPSVTIAAGQSAQVVETINPLYNFNSSISFTWSNQSTWPLGLTAVFAQNPASGSTTIAITTTTNTPAGTFKLDLTGSGGGLAQHFASVFVTVTRTTEFSVYIPPPLTQTVGQGGSTSYIVNVNGGFESSVNLTVSAGLPAGVTASFNPSFINGTGAAILTIKALSNATLASSYPITVSATRGALIHSTKVFLTVVAPAPATMTSPVENGYLVKNSSVKFIWTSGFGVSEYQLMLGSVPGGADYTIIANAASPQLATTPDVAQVRTVHATLRSKIAGSWQSLSYTYTVGPASNAAGSVLPRQAATFFILNDSVSKVNSNYCLGPLGGACDDQHFDSTHLNKCVVVGDDNNTISVKIANVSGHPSYYDLIFSANRSATVGSHNLQCNYDNNSMSETPNAVTVYDATPVITGLEQYSPEDPNEPNGTFRVVIIGNYFGTKTGQLVFCTNSTGPSCNGTTELQLFSFLSWNDDRIEALLKPSPAALGDFYVGVLSIGAQGTGFLAQTGGTFAASPTRGRVNISPGAPVITSFEPNEVFPGESGTLKINGRNLKVGASNPFAFVERGTGLVLREIQSATATQIQINYSSSIDTLPGVQKISVQNASGTDTHELPLSPKTFVFLVHGIGQSATQMSQLAVQLRDPAVISQLKPGTVINELFSLYTSGGCTGIANSAQIFESYVRLFVNPGNNMVLVGYSMGGLLSRQLILDDNFRSLYLYQNVPSILGLVTLGTPNLGYPRAGYDFLSPGPGCDQQTLDMASNFQSRQAESPPEVDFSMGSEYMTRLRAGWVASSSYRNIKWLAASGRVCSNPTRSTGLGCPVAKPVSDGIVCEVSAGWGLSQLDPWGPTEKWADETNQYRHAGLLGIGDVSALCTGSPGSEVMYMPTDRSELFLTIVDFLRRL